MKIDLDNIINAQLSLSYFIIEKSKLKKDSM